MQRLRPHLSYANIVATLALVVAVAGGTTAVAVSAGKKKGAVVRVTKGSDVSKKGNVRSGHVTASKLAGVDVVQRRFTVSVPGNVAECPSGEQLVGGGAVIHPSSPPGTALESSGPNGNGWLGIASQASADYSVYALCLR
jgi:hypothetical protein